AGQVECARVLHFHRSGPTTKPSTQPQPGRIEFPADGAGVRATLARAGDRLLLPARVNDAQPRPFMLDTAPPGIVINDELAREQRLRTEGQAIIDGNPYPVVAVEALRTGGFTLSQTLAVATDLSRLGVPPELRRIRGIIGGEMLRQTPFTINWSGPTLTIRK